jgi:acetyltransferase-like isoleucine patch superfamily enzyme
MRLTAVRGSIIHSTSKLESGTAFYDSTLGRHSFCGYDCDVASADIGNFVSIANHVVIGGGRHPMEWVGMSPVFYEGRDSVKAKFSTHKRQAVERILIGHDVWIGHSEIILPGVSIGHGAVVGAGAVVTKAVPPYAIVAGNPAKIIRFRFDDDTVKNLLLAEWWILSDSDLKDFAPYFNRVEKFLEVINKDIAK